MIDIKAIILDVDGVIVGEKIGFNSPHPHSDVTKALKKIQDSGVFVSLCTAKPHFAISKEIKDADLNNVHITDGGGVIIDPLANKIVKQNILPSESAAKVIEAFITADVYTEFYTVDNYFIQESQKGDITKKHAHVLQDNPIIVDSLIDESMIQKVTKVMPIAINEDDKDRLDKVFSAFENELVMSWGVHPVILPLQFGIITAPGISKKQGAKEIAAAINVDFEHILGVGDSGSDWQFIEMCGYGAAMGNASQELKDKVSSKKDGKAFIAPSVDENGIIKVFEYFGLL